MTDLGPVLAELRAAQIALSSAVMELGNRRRDLAPVIHHLSSQVDAVTLDLCLATKEQEVYRRPRGCLFCGRKLPFSRGVGRPRKFCSDEHGEQWRNSQKRIERRAAR